MPMGVLFATFQACQYLQTNSLQNCLFLQDHTKMSAIHLCPKLSLPWHPSFNYQSDVTFHTTFLIHLALNL